MAIINLTNSGSRRSMTDGTRWRAAPDVRPDPETLSQPEPVRAPDPVPELEPVQIVDTSPEIVGGNTAAEIARELDDEGNVDHSLRDRIRRISRRPQRDEDAPQQEERRPRGRRSTEEPRAELSEDAFSFTPAGPKGRDKQPDRPAPEREPGKMRQSARRREDPSAAAGAHVPAKRTPTEPEVHTTGVQASESEVDMLRSEIDELRREMSEMREAISRIDQPSSSPKGMGAVERTMQRLAERMDRIDGGPPVQNVAIQDGRPTGGPRKGFFKSLFG
jgi:hypothetical protein